MQKRLSGLLNEYAVLPQEELIRLQKRAKAIERHLVLLLVEEAGIDGAALLSLFSPAWGCETWRGEDLLQIHPAPFLLDQVSPSFALKWGLLPWRWKQDWQTLELICLAWPSPAVEAELKRRTHAKRFKIVLCSASDFLQAHRHHYGGPEAVKAEATQKAELNAAISESLRLSSGSMSALDRVLDGRWKLKEPLAKGGMGSVFLAEDLEEERQVAVKLLHSQFRMDPTERQRFVLEGRILQKLQHPNIVHVYDVGFADELGLFSVMELLRGCNLYETYERLGLLTWDFLIKAFVLVCDAMNYAHKQRVLHRDLKPENIFLVGGVKTAPEVRVLDFGIAKLLDYQQQLTQTGITLGTPLYIAPEQAMGLSLDERADVYALSAILFECFTGKPPFDFNTAYQVMGAKVAEPPPTLAETLPHVHWPEQLETLMARGLATRPEQRYGNMVELRDALLLCLQKISITQLKQQRKQKPSGKSMEVDVAWQDDAQGIIESNTPTIASPTVIPSELITSMTTDTPPSLDIPELAELQAKKKKPDQRFVETVEVERIPTRLRGMKEPESEHRPSLRPSMRRSSPPSRMAVAGEQAPGFLARFSEDPPWGLFLGLVYLLVGVMLYAFWMVA